MSYSMLEYMYRDAGNWKTHGVALLLGNVGALDATIRSCLDPGALFVPEQVLLPGLHRRHWNQYGDGPSDLDHALHEFVGLRNVEKEDAELHPLIGSTTEVAALFLEARGRWDARYSRYLREMYSGWVG